ncbi:MAG TPA: phosphatase domain-containing protein [Thermoanaerobaculia bacterium]|nr:phosphatase domain-containing protein [Thermoanaerobaculia bacterium]
MPPPRLLLRTALELERRFDRRLAGRPVSRKVVISPYRGFGTANELLVRGRVLVDKRVTHATAAEPLWRNVLNTYRRFQSDEVANARIVAAYREAVVESVTNDEGYFTIRVPNVGRASARPVDGRAEARPTSTWLDVQLTLPDHGVENTAHVLVPRDDARFGVISDIDDTIVRTNATSLLGVTRSIINNAAARLPFEGVAELYRALDADRNPIFYVSSSPWNLYELLHDYMDVNHIPHGPMLLQDWGIEETVLILASHAQHKMAQINSILDYYPALKFVLIGDSGQHDPEIYLQTVRAHPGRVLAAFIRDVTPDLRDRAVAKIIEESNAAGVEMLYVKDSAEAMEHARRIGLIS